MSALVALLCLGVASCGKDEEAAESWEPRLENRWELTGVEFFGEGGGAYSPEGDGEPLGALRTSMGTPQVWIFQRDGYVRLIKRVVDGEFEKGTGPLVPYSSVAAQRKEVVITYRGPYKEGTFEIGDRSMTLTTSSEQLVQLIRHYKDIAQVAVNTSKGEERKKAREFVKALEACRLAVQRDGVSAQRSFVYLEQLPVEKN